MRNIAKALGIKETKCDMRVIANLSKLLFMLYVENSIMDNKVLDETADIIIDTIIRYAGINE